jgi:hypothetical protein
VDGEIGDLARMLELDLDDVTRRGPGRMKAR